VCSGALADDSSPCDDGSACTHDDVCSGGTCIGTSVSCEDGNDCTIDTCDKTTGSCLTENEDDGAWCGTPDACSEAVCHSGMCVSSANNVCDDNDPCTADACQDADGQPACDHAPIPGCSG
jgi:hypothetical protein